MTTARTAQFEHAVLRVNDLDTTVDFYRTVLGLVEIGREDGVVYLGCGLDRNHQLGLCAGGTGVEHFALRAHADELDVLESRLRDHGVAVERRANAAPGEEECLRFELPNGTTMEIAVPADRDYIRTFRPAFPERFEGITPLDVDHIN